MKGYDLFLESSGICTDTRKITKDCFFVCLKGDNFNGNDFAQQALDAGAKTVVVDDTDKGQLPGTLLVEDGLRYLQTLANHHRKQFNIPVIGITGSNGKTTSKELIATVLSSKYNVHFTKGNLNNHIGVPLTLLGLNENHKIAVIEMGASRFKDIIELAEIAEPNRGIITNIGKAHLEGFGGFEGVKKTKKELYDFIESADGQLIVNADDETLMDIRPKQIKTSFYGKNPERGIGGKLKRLTPFVEFEWAEGTYKSRTLKTNLVGEYNFYNFLAAIAFGRHFDIEADQINKAIESYQPSNNRSQVSKTDRNTLIVDCYNANPTSMSSALSSFNQIDHSNKLAIIGDMRELGTESFIEHQKIFEYAEGMEAQFVYVGEEFKKVINENSTWFADVSSLLASNKLKAVEDSLILLKGSRGIRLEEVIGVL